MVVVCYCQYKLIGFNNISFSNINLLLTFSYFCLLCVEQDTTADAKKTDAVQPDDDATAAAADKEESVEETKTNSSPKKKKSDLDVKDGAEAAEPEEEDSGKDSTEDIDGGASEEKETEVSLHCLICIHYNC